MIKPLLVMTLVSCGMRILPFIFSESMQKWAFLQRISVTLPACLTILLVAHCVESTTFGIAEAVGLSAVALTQALSRNILASMGVGVLLHQVVLHL